MPTFPTFDPANLPPYPEKPHKTGQARVNVDGKSQYLGKYGTVESHALYHLACARKLTTGVVPATRDLRDELSRVAGHEEPRRHITPSLMTVITLTFVAVMISGATSHYLTKAAIKQTTLQRVVAKKPVIENLNSDVGEKMKGEDNRFPQVFPSVEMSVSELQNLYPRSEMSSVVEKVATAVEEMERKKTERSRTHETNVDPTIKVGES